MSSVFLSPHADDGVLWGGFLILHHRPKVITVLKSAKQEQFGIMQHQREAEDAQAMGILGVTNHVVWPEDDLNPDWDAIRSMIAELDYDSSEFVDRVFAPAIEDNGHEQHTMVGQLARDIFGDRVTHYLTYTRTSGRSTSQNEIKPEPWMIPLKLQALACYTTQMRPETGTQTWFLDGIREWIV